MANENEKNDVFKAFLDRAMKRLDEKKKHKTCRLHVPGMDETITVRGLSRAEIAEVMDTDDSSDPYAGDKYTVYLATVEPDLRKAAKELKEAGKIREYPEVCDIFDIYEIREIATKVTELSGLSGKQKVEVVTDSLKN